jgi:hypothetical protein
MNKRILKKELYPSTPSAWAADTDTVLMTLLCYGKVEKKKFFSGEIVKHYLFQFIKVNLNSN